MGSEQTKKTIENTTKFYKENPGVALLDALVRGTSGPDGMIEHMEAEGQKQLVQSAQLPAEMGDRARFEALGFTFGEPDPDDALFVPATLPTGWKKVATEHSMWSDIVDEKGRPRVGVFYKAAFYDRKAHMRLTRRFEASTDQDRAVSGPITPVIRDSDGSAHVRLEPIAYDGVYGSPAWAAAANEADERALAYLVEHFPDHKNPLAYWDITDAG